MRPYFEKQGISLYLGDSEQIVPILPPGFDALVTDPPYAIVNKFADKITRRGTGSEGRQRMTFDWDHERTAEMVGNVIKGSLDLCHAESSCFVFCGGDLFGRILEVIRDSGFCAKQAAWVKKHPSPSGKGMRWCSAFELAAWGYRPRAWFGDTDRKRSNVFVHDSYRYGQPGKNGHPTQKPLALMKHLISSLVPPNGRCLDPFVGSGTTLVAAQQEGRRAVGIELNERYAEIAAYRLERGETTLCASRFPRPFRFPRERLLHSF